MKQEITEQLADRLVERIEETNAYIYKKIGNVIKTMSTLKPSDAYQLSQILKYGGSYEEIANELAKASGKNVQEIYRIFDEVAKNNKQFAKDFYEFRGVQYVPYSQDIALQQQVKSLATLTANTYINISNTKGIGFLFKDLSGQMTFKNIQQSYYEIIDRGILSISQGKESFNTEMRRIMKQLGHNGVVLYDNGRTRRLDSALRMNLLDGIRLLNQETTKRFGQEYGANMIEVSHHTNSAPDHIDTVDGRQFAQIDVIKEQIQNGTETEIKLSDIDGDRVKVNGKWYKDFDSVNNSIDRQVGTLNCRHYTFTGILGISKPLYTEEQLEKDKEKNLEGFEFEGKHYTLYERRTTAKEIRITSKKK